MYNEKKYGARELNDDELESVSGGGTINQTINQFLETFVCRYKNGKDPCPYDTVSEGEAILYGCNECTARVVAIPLGFFT